MNEARMADRSSPGDIIIAPSILSADFARLGQEVRPSTMLAATGSMST